MQTPKTRNGSGRMSPSSQTSQKLSPSASRVSRQVKVAKVGSDSTESQNSTRKRSPKVLERGSPQSPITEKKRVSKLSNLETQLAQLEDELKKTKEHLNSSESLKRRALQEGEEMKKQLAITYSKLEDSLQQLDEFSTSEDARIQELQKLSQERDKVWQSEVEAIQKQYSMDSTALAAALNEIQKLKSKDKQSNNSEIECLRSELSETVDLLEKMRKQINDSRDSEAQAMEVARETQMQLKDALMMAEALKSEGMKSKEEYNSLLLELEKSKEKSGSLEKTVIELEKKLKNTSPEQDEGDELKNELEALKEEVNQLKSALEASEHRYQEEYIQSTMQIRNAFDQLERTKSETSAREAELQSELKKSITTINELKLKLNFKSEETEVEILKGDLQDLKSVLLDKETQIQKNKAENETLKAKIQNRENEEGDTSAKASPMVKLGYLTEEAEMNTEKLAQVSKQLEAAQRGNTELETELRKLKIQSDQWRKAAEAAASMLSTGSNNIDGKFVERSVSFDSIGVKLESSLSDDTDDDLTVKKNGNMLKKFGVLWKKGQK